MKVTTRIPERPEPVIILEMTLDEAMKVRLMALSSGHDISVEVHRYLVDALQGVEKA